MRGPNQTLFTLQAGRGLAALAVVLTHAREATQNFVAPIQPLVRDTFALGSLGVDFFFVLSGFIILHSHWEDDRLARYLQKRVTRIWVPYLPVTIVLMALLTTSIGPMFAGWLPPQDWGVMTSIFLIPSEYHPALIPAWSLVHEVIFYAVFVVYFFSRRFFFITVCLWAAAIGAFAALQSGIFSTTPQAMKPAYAVLVQEAAPVTRFLMQEAKQIVRTVLAPINIEFILGMACVVLANRIDKTRGRTILLAGLFLAVFALLAILKYQAPHEIFGIAMAVTVLGLVLTEQQIRVPTWLVYFGAASYAIYLTHYPIVEFTSKLLHGAAWPASVALLFVLGTVSGLIYHQFVEKPGMRLARAAPA